NRICTRALTICPKPDILRLLSTACEPKREARSNYHSKHDPPPRSADAPKVASYPTLRAGRKGHNGPPSARRKSGASDLGRRILGTPTLSHGYPDQGDAP